jgi:hypothetical protein
VAFHGFGVVVYSCYLFLFVACTKALGMVLVRYCVVSVGFSWYLNPPDSLVERGIYTWSTYPLCSCFLHQTHSMATLTSFIPHNDRVMILPSSLVQHARKLPTLSEPQLGFLGCLCQQTVWQPVRRP